MMNELRRKLTLVRYSGFRQRIAKRTYKTACIHNPVPSLGDYIFPITLPDLINKIICTQNFD